MSKDKLEDDAKKRVREETEQIERGDAPWQKSEKPGGFRDLFEDMWRDLEDPQDGSGADRIVGAIRSGVRRGDAAYAAMT